MRYIPRESTQSTLNSKRGMENAKEEVTTTGNQQPRPQNPIYRIMRRIRAHGVRGGGVRQRSARKPTIIL